MKKTQQLFRNETSRPLYIYIEPWPHAFELETNDEILIVFQVEDDAERDMDVHLHGDNEVTVYPNFRTERWLGYEEDLVKIFINGEAADDRSWKFKHKKFE